MKVISGVLGASLTSNLICKLGYAGLIPLCAGFQFIGKACCVCVCVCVCVYVCMYVCMYVSHLVHYQYFKVVVLVTFAVNCMES